MGGQGPRAVSLLHDKTRRHQTSEQPGFHDVTGSQTPRAQSPSHQLLWSDLQPGWHGMRATGYTSPDELTVRPREAGQKPLTLFMSNKNSGRQWEEKGRQVRETGSN